jgi:O-antigen ligase
VPRSIPIPPPHRALALAFYVMPGLAVVSDPSPVPLLLIALVAMLPGALRAGWRPRRPRARDLALPALALAWAAVTLFWTPDSVEGADTLYRLTLLVIAGWLLADLVARALPATSEAAGLLARSMIGGLAVAAAVLAVEMLLDHPIVRTFEWDWRPQGVRDHETNRGASLILMLAWLALPVALYRPLGRAWTLLAAGAAVASFLLTESAASQLAALAGGGLLLVALAGPWLRRGAWVLIVLAGVGAMPWFAQTAFDQGLHQAGAMPHTAQQRIHIWNYTSQWALERPLTGWGFDASQHLGNRGVEPAAGKTDVIPLHPHNGQLQIWLELGVGGALVLALWLGWLAWRIERTPAPWPPWFAAAVGTAFVIAGIGYGAWQHQWIASLLWLWVYAQTARHTVEGRAAGGNG